MSKLSEFKNFISMPQPIKVVNRFKKDEEGATAVEFAIVGGPFFLLVFAIIESSLLFFANQYLETVVDDVARLYRTGRTGDVATAAKLKEEMCDRIVALFNCNRIITHVDVAEKFTDLPPPPQSNNVSNLDGDGNYAPPERFDDAAVCPGQVVQFTASYEWPIYTNYAAPLVSEGLNNNALINVTAVVRTEEFQAPPGVTCPP